MTIIPKSEIKLVASPTETFPQDIIEILMEMNSDEAVRAYCCEQSSVLGAIDLIDDCILEIVRKKPSNIILGFGKLIACLNKYRYEFIDVIEKEVLMSCIVWNRGDYENIELKVYPRNYPQYRYIDKTISADGKLEILYSVGNLNGIYLKSIFKIVGYFKDVDIIGSSDKIEEDSLNEIEGQFYHYLQEIRLMWKYIIEQIESIIKRLKAELDYINYQEITANLKTDSFVTTIRKILRFDIDNFIHNEGFYKPVDKIVFKGIDEDLIQKSLKLQIENSLLRKKIDATVIREPQNYDDKRPDFLIINNKTKEKIVIETKLSHNVEITNALKREIYKGKIINNYIKGMNASYCFYLIFLTKNDNEEQLKQLKEDYDFDMLETIIFNLRK